LLRCSAPSRETAAARRGQTGDSRGRDGGDHPRLSSALIKDLQRELHRSRIRRLSVLVSHHVRQQGHAIAMACLRGLPTVPSPNLAARVVHDVKAVSATCADTFIYTAREQMATKNSPV